MRIYILKTGLSSRKPPWKDLSERLGKALCMEIRRASESDAPAICRLVRLCYGETYLNRDLYDPARTAEWIRSGGLVSVLAVEGEQVAGHYALERDGAELAMTGIALVDPAFRGRGLMHRLRETVEALALELRLRAIYGTAVTNHTRSQTAYDRLGNVPTGLLTNMAREVRFEQLDVTSQEQAGLTLVHYFKLLGELKAPSLYCPAVYQGLLDRLLDKLGVSADLRPPAAGGGGFQRPPRPGKAVPWHQVDLGKPRVVWRPDGCDVDTVADWLDFPMAEDGWGAAFATARSRGYRFAALVPLTVEGSFRLRLQKIPPNLDWDSVMLHHPLAHEIRGFMGQEAL